MIKVISSKKLDKLFDEYYGLTGDWPGESTFPIKNKFHLEYDLSFDDTVNLLNKSLKTNKPICRIDIGSKDYLIVLESLDVLMKSFSTAIKLTKDKMSAQELNEKLEAEKRLEAEEKKEYERLHKIYGKK